MKRLSKLKSKIKEKTKSVSKSKTGEAQAQALPQAVLNASTSTSHLSRRPDTLQSRSAVETDATSNLSSQSAIIPAGPRLVTDEVDESSVIVQVPQVFTGREASNTSPLNDVEESRSDHQNDASREEPPRNREGHEPADDIRLLPGSPPKSLSGNSVNNKEPEDLWHRAYELLRHESESLVKTYEEILESRTSTSGSPKWETLTGRQRESAMQDLISKQLEIQDQAKWRLRLGNKTIEFQKQFSRVVKLVVIAKGIVTSAVAPSPQASIAWAGVCIILPLLLNPSLQMETNISGLEEVASLISRSSIRERTYRQELQKKANETHQAEDDKLLSDLENAMCQLYRIILEFQARTVCQLLRSKVTRTTRDIFKADDWADLVENMKKADANCIQYTQTIDSERLRYGLKDLQQTLKEQAKNLDLLLQSLTEQQESKAYNDILRVLKTCDYVFNKDKNPVRVAGTCEWFSSHSKFGAWLHNDSSLLWVSADPGCGKSVLARYLIDDRLSEALSSSQKVCYFFFKDDDEKHRSATHALCAVLHQLLLQDSQLLRHFNFSTTSLPSFGELWDALTRCAQETSIICVFDALDECEESSRDQLLRTVSMYFGSYAHPIRNLRIILTSRPWNSISDKLFYGTNLDKEAIHLMGENEEEEEQISTEIGLVIEARLLEFKDFRQWKGIDDDAHSILQTRLDSIQNRTYLWVALIFSELQKRAADAKKILLGIIDTIPRSINEAYEKILNQSTDFDRARKLLHIIVAAFRPLTIEELNIALSIHEGDCCLQDIELTPKSSFGTVLRELCGLLVSIIGNKIYLIHQTVKEFLQKAVDATDTSSGTLQWRHSLDGKDSHKVLAWSCARYLLLDDFEDGLFPPRDADIFDILEPQDPALGVIPSFGNPLGHYRLHRRTQRTQSTVIDTNELKNLPTTNRIVQKKLANHLFLGYAASYWYSHYLLSGDKDSLDIVASTLWQLTTPRGRLWFAIRGNLLNYPRLPTVLWRNFGPLTVHAYLGHTSLIEQLLPETDDSTESQIQVKIALQLAIKAGHEDIVRNIIKTKQEITTNCTFHDFSTPISCAMVACHPKIVQILLQSGHKLDFHQNIICDVLRDIGPSTMYPTNVGIFPRGSTLPQDSAKIVAEILKAGGNINQQSIHKELPLMLAVQQMNFEGVRALLDSDSGALNIPSSNWIREHNSTNYPKVDMQERLNINALEEQGYSALHFIRGARHEFPVPGDISSHEYYDFFMNEQYKIVSYLLAKGGDPNIRNAEGITPLHVAVLSHRIEIIEELVKKGANIDARRDGGFTPLHDVCYCFPADPPDDYKASFKTRCRCRSTQEMLRILIKHGANLEAEDSAGCTPLMLAASKQVPFVFHSLMEVGANINAQDQQGNTCLHSAVLGQVCPLIDILYYRDHLNIDAQNFKSRTALHLAAEIGDMFSIVLLLACGADASIVDDRNWSPLHVAMNRRCGYSVWLLLMAQDASHALTLSNGGTILELAHNMAEELRMLRDFEMSDIASDNYPTPPHIYTPTQAQSPLSGSDKSVESLELLHEPPMTSLSTPLQTRFARGTTIPPFSGRYKTGRRPGGRRPFRPWPSIRPPPASRRGNPDGRIFDEWDLRIDYFLLREDLSDASEDLDIVSDTASVTSDRFQHQSSAASSVDEPVDRDRLTDYFSDTDPGSDSSWKGEAPIHTAARRRRNSLAPSFVPSINGNRHESSPIRRVSSSGNRSDELSRENLPATDTNKQGSDQLSETSDSPSQTVPSEKNPIVGLEDIWEMQAAQNIRSYSSARAVSPPTSQKARSLTSTRVVSLGRATKASSSASQADWISRRGPNASLARISRPPIDECMGTFILMGTRCVDFAQRVCDIASSYEPGLDHEPPDPALEASPWTPSIPGTNFVVINRILEAAQSLPVAPESEIPEAKEHFFVVKQKREKSGEAEGNRQKAQWFDSSIVHPTRRSVLQAMDISIQPPSPVQTRSTRSSVREWD